MVSHNLDLFNSGLDDPPGVAPIFTVTDFVAVINQTLSVAYPDVIVEGEVSSYKVNQNKFVFFDLKDEMSFVGCFMMVFNLRVPLEDGMKVRVKATPKLTDKGRFSLTIKSIQLSGEGSLKRAYEILKTKLEKEGLFASARKRILPELPQRVVIIASGDSAGYGDFEKIADERWGGVEFDLMHVQVQGEDAPRQVIEALDFANESAQSYDVIVLIRGGGSLEDLAAFNDEAVARAIASSRIPTLVGVGHEVDVTLAGLAADKRASTPSNAAQILLPDRREYLSLVDGYAISINNFVTRLIDGRRRESRDKLDFQMGSLLETKLNDISALMRALKGYNPRQALQRGYSIARFAGSVLKSGKSIKSGDAIVLELSDALIDSEVKNVKAKN